MSKIKKYMPKVLSGVLSLTILCCTIGVASYSAGAKSTDTETTNTNISDNSSTAKNASEDKTKKLSKNETVYIIANADGSPKKVIVSDWIKNTAKAKSFGDISNLDNIVNVKGDETYTVNENNMYEWSADGNDIYYQGTGKSELPVGLSVSYTLDGKKISADKLAGQSGKVKIRFDYTNRQSEKIKIDGKEEEIYVPFVMLTGMMLDNDVFRNVEVSNGKVVNDGSHTFVAGFALPGMQSNLGIDSKDFEIPDYVEITTDVKNFELATSFTLAANDMFSDIDFSKVDDKIDALSDSLDELTDAADQLIDGSSQLYDGLKTLLDKSGELIEGVDQLYDGAEKISSGAQELDNGAGALASGAKDLDNGVGTLKDGADSLNSGAQSLKDGTGELNSGAKNLAQGVASLKEGSSALVSGVKQLKDGSMTLNDGLKKFKEDGIDVLVDAVGGDVNRFVSRLKAVSEVSSHYKSYSGISDDMDGKVDFIYKTDSIEK